MTDRPTNQQTDMRGHREVALLTTLTELLYLFISSYQGSASQYSAPKFSRNWYGADQSIAGALR